MDFDDELHEEGFLEKQGKLKFSWKRYWFVLRRDKLHYYKDPQNRNDANAGLIDVSRAQSVRKCFQSNHGHSFEIVTKNRMHMLSADTAKSCDAWIKKLQQAMQYERRSSVRLSQAQLEPQPSFSEISDDEYEAPSDMYEAPPNSSTGVYEVFDNGKEPSSATTERSVESSKCPPSNGSPSTSVVPPVPKQRIKSLKSPGPVSPIQPMSLASSTNSGEYYEVQETSLRTKIKNASPLASETDGAYESVEEINRAKEGKTDNQNRETSMRTEMKNASPLASNTDGAYESIGEIHQEKDDKNRSQNYDDEEEEELYATCEDPAGPSSVTVENGPNEMYPYAKVCKKGSTKSRNDCVLQPANIDKYSETNKTTENQAPDAKLDNRDERKLQKQESVDDIPWMNFDFPPIPEDPHPCIGYAQSFKELSDYLKNNFKMSGISVVLRKSEKGGASVQKMRNSLSDEEDVQFSP